MRPAATKTAAATAAAFVVYLWAFAYLTDAPLVLLSVRSPAWALLAFAIAPVLAWTAVTRLGHLPTPAALCVAGMALVLCAGVRDAAALYAGSNDPSTLVHGAPIALVWAAAAATAVWLLGAARPQTRKGRLS